MTPSNNDSFEFKTTSSSLLVLTLPCLNHSALMLATEQRLAEMAGMFDNEALILDLSAWNDGDALNIHTLVQLFAQCQLKVVGVRHVPNSLQTLCISAGLALFAPEPTHKSARTAPITEAATPNYKETMIVDKPVRAGQQIYAKDGDLIVLASVSAGAEVLADGNIHIYGTLRGKAHAGVKGNEKSRIFVHIIEAEMISIAGCYRTLDSTERYSAPTQIQLEGNRLEFSLLDKF